jgi:hypothetical protein
MFEHRGCIETGRDRAETLDESVQEAGLSDQLLSEPLLGVASR